MYNYHNKKKFIYSIFLILLLAIGIGYAYLTSNLSITGNTSVSTNTWNIHFENIQVKDGSVTATTTPTLSNNNTSITYTVDLNRPKEFYEFNVDVKNDGTLPGKVSISELSGITTESQSIIDYSVSYTNGNPVSIGDILNAGTKKTIRVRVFYKDEIDPTDFPANNLNLTLTYILQYVQSEEEEVTAGNLIQNLAKTESCIFKYEGDVTDQVGVTVPANNVYFDRCTDKRNVIFAGNCWQMIRTTETGGIKMIYNGEPDNNGRCGLSRSSHKGIVQSTNGTSDTINSSYLYGSSFTYDTTNNTFTLTNTTTATWSDSTYEDLIGKFTCMTNSDTCTTLYNINGYYSNTRAYLSYYTIANTNYAQIGTSAYNANSESLAMSGYMFNKVYGYTNSALTSGSLMGNDVSYSNGTYTLLPADGESTLGTTKDATHHYTCNNTTGTCNKVRFYYYNDYYIELDGEENIDEVINNMLYSNNVNRYNSSIKGIIDAWYAQNLSTKTNMLEDTVYCNTRNMINQETNGWNKDGSLSTSIFFKNYSLDNDISCLNETDQFAVSNNKAKLTYPVSLAPAEELYTLTDKNKRSYYSVLTKTGVRWWKLSPIHFGSISVSIGNVATDGDVFTSSTPSINFGVRPVVSLSSGAVIFSGDGSTENPFVIQE